MTKRQKPPILASSPLHSEDRLWAELFASDSEEEKSRLNENFEKFVDNFAKKQGYKIPPLIRRGRIPDGISSWTNLRTAEHSIALMRDRKIKSVKLYANEELNFGKAILGVLQIYIRRADGLIGAMASAWEDKQEISSAILARALIEVVAMFDWIATHLLHADQKDDLQTMHSVLEVAMFSTARLDADSESIRPPRITHVLEQFETRNPKAKKFYDQISDVVHPNGDASVDWLSNLVDGELTFGKSRLPERERFIPVYNALLSVCYWMCSSFDLVDELVKKHEQTKVARSVLNEFRSANLASQRSGQKKA